jgi:cytochrome P450 family 135
VTRAAVDLGDQRTSLPPGPSAISLLRGLPGLEPDLDRVLNSWFDRYGLMFTKHVPTFGQVVLLADAAMVRATMTADPTLIDSTEGARSLEPVYGPGSMLFHDGPAHRQLRRLLSPPLRGEALQLQHQTIVGVAERAVESWPVGEPITLFPRMQAIGLEIILRVVLGIDDAERLACWGPAFHRLLGMLVSEQFAIRYATRRVGGMRSWLRFRRARAACDRLIYTEIARRSQGALTDATDVLGLLLNARDENDRPLTSSYIHDQLMTLIVAGHETTATTTAWAFERVLRHAGVLKRLTREAQSGTGDDYTQAVITETLRLRAPLIFITRRVRARFQLGPYVLAPGTWIWLYLPRLHRDPTTFRHPDRFEPERFLTLSPPSFAWLPFGGGAHRCLGDHFTRFEIATIMQTILRCAKLRAANPADEPIKRHAFAHRPGHGCRVIVERRQRQSPPAAVPTTLCPAHAGT